MEIKLGSIWINPSNGNEVKVVEVLPLTHAGETIDRITYETISGKKFKSLKDDFVSKYVAKPEEVAQGEPEGPKIGKIMEPNPDLHNFRTIVLYPEAEASIKRGLHLIQNRAVLDELYDIKKLEPSEKTALNFYGPPGTGKTISAMAIANEIGKKVLFVDYSQIISKWVGDTGKHIAEVFKTATDNDCILFFDEADSLVSKRISMENGDGVTNSVNQNRNILMQELDRFQGIVLFATNFYKNYDEAILRRIAMHVEFKLPNKPMRKQILDNFLSGKIASRLSGVDTDRIADLTDSFGGGDLKNVVYNSIVAASMTEDKLIRHGMIAEQIEGVRSSKAAHRGK